MITDTCTRDVINGDGPTRCPEATLTCFVVQILNPGVTYFLGQLDRSMYEWDGINRFESQTHRETMQVKVICELVL